MGKQWWGNEGRREWERRRAQWPCPMPLMCAMIHAHLWVCVPVGVQGPAAYLWLLMLWSVASDGPTSLWPPVIQTCLFQPTSYMKGKGQATGTYGAGVWWLWLIFITQVPGVCAWVSVCAFKPAKAWVEQKKSHLPDYLHDSTALWNFKEPSHELCILPASLFHREAGWESGGSSSAVPCHRGVLWEEGVVLLPRCFTEAWICPDISHLWTPRRLACLQPSVLMHYRSSRNHRYRLAKADTLFSSHGLFL